MHPLVVLPLLAVVMAMSRAAPHETGFPHPHPHPPGYVDPPGFGAGSESMGQGESHYVGDGHDHSHDLGAGRPSSGSSSGSARRLDSAPASGPMRWSQPVDENGVGLGTGSWTGMRRNKRQHYDHSHCYWDHCHDVYSDGHEHVRGRSFFDLFNFGRR